MNGINIPRTEIELDPSKSEQSGVIEIPITQEVADQMQTEGAPDIHSLEDLVAVKTGHQTTSTGYKGTSTNKDRKRKKKERQNRKKGRR